MKPTVVVARSFVVLFVCPVAVVAVGVTAQADNQVTVRGQYYREPSTRVVQPVVEIAKDLPGGIDIRAHSLLDAITSASAASGPSGDNIFTEYRSEAGFSARASWSRWRVRLGYKYSAESDYWSHAFSASATLRTWGDTGALILSLGGGFDQVGRRIQGTAPTPAGSTACAPGGRKTCPLETMFGGIGYSQVLSPTILVQGGYEFAYQEGYISSPYRMEMLPDKRLRNALLARVAKYFPGSGTGLQVHYRYYWDLYPGEHSDWEMPSAQVVRSKDPWGVKSGTYELRVFQAVGPDLEVRLTGRYYAQGEANIRCDVVADPGCQSSVYSTNQPQLARIYTGFVEGKLYWEARRWRGVPFVGWFSEGTFELSYGRYLQTTSFADAHVLQTAYSLPF